MTTPSPAQPSDITGAIAAVRPKSPLDTLPPLPPPDFATVEGGGYHPSQVRSWVKKVGDRILAMEHWIEDNAPRVVHDVAVVESNPRARQLTADLVRIAMDEIAGQQAQAAADAAKMLEDARSQAAGIINAAHAEAGQVTGGAHEQANQILSDARNTAKQVTDEANAKAAAIDEGAQARLTAMVNIHQQSVVRLREITDRAQEVAQVTADYVAREAQRGSLADEVDNILAPLRQGPPAQQPVSAPQPRASRRPSGAQPIA